MRFFEEIQVGESYDLGFVTMEASVMDEFARKYNRSWLHTDAQAMKETKYGDIIAPGMLTFSAGWTPFIDLDVFERAEIGGKRTTVEWYKAVYAGDVLSSKASVMSKTPWNDRVGNVQVEIETYNQHGILVVKSTNEMFVRRRMQNKD